MVYVRNYEVDHLTVEVFKRLDERGNIVKVEVWVNDYLLATAEPYSGLFFDKDSVLIGMEEHPE